MFDEEKRSFLKPEETTPNKPGVWKSQWAVINLYYGKAQGTAKDVETALPIPACDQARDLVQALLQHFETIQWDEPTKVGEKTIESINKLFHDFESCPCSNYCNKPTKKNDSRRRLVERFIRASEYCISS